MTWDDEDTSSSEGEWQTPEDEPIIEQEELAAVFVSPLDASVTFDNEEDLEAHLEETYGFTLRGLCERRKHLSSLEAFYNRCRIINYLRKHSEEQTLPDILANLTSDDASLWTENSYLIPVLADDALLRMSESVWQDEDGDQDSDVFRPPVLADPLPSKEHMLERGQQLTEQFQCLQELG